MKNLYLATLGMLMAFAGMAQTDTLTSKSTTDTIRVGDIIILRNPDSARSREYRTYDEYPEVRYKRDRIETNWLILDLGFANYNDRTNYQSAEAIGFVRNYNGQPEGKSGDFDLKTRSSNINIWLFMQRMSLYRNVINLKYGLGIEMNNYFYKSDIRYIDDASASPNVYVVNDTVSFSRNKLAADYLTVPFMINFNTNPGSRKGGLSISFGVSAGYLYSARNKQKSDERGKRKAISDFNLERWKIAYVGELGLGPIKLYGSYAITPLHRYGLEQYPYAVGIRLSSW